ncbi:hypothetical protein LCI18_009541 [Fusarium solani-melongenae]|uniref:Uncharacterized protein n=1 Tax=Fusarium solani subsp. cucurbitae TaxID=2747967 RepID=A0ACD3ZBN1_FUSSC|nr:hypothetical protein LCI18_009541 [Fusarium solani-melongenae]
MSALPFTTILTSALPITTFDTYPSSHPQSPLHNVKMLSRAAVRTTTSLVTKRGFQTTRARLSSPYHYPEGAYSNIPFNPRSKWFGVGFWGFMATGFFAPFGISVWQTYKPT